MASQFDDSDFVDRDFQSEQGGYVSAHAGVANRPPTREELEAQVGHAQQKLAELRRAQEELERERTVLEEARRRRAEFQTGREEMLQNLTRGVALLEQAEFAARRDAEQMAKTLIGLREAHEHIGAIRDETWSQENWNVELTKALATIENARMEWNAARLKWSLLNGPAAEAANKDEGARASAAWENMPFAQLCRIGLALTWPVALVGLITAILLLTLRGR